MARDPAKRDEARRDVDAALADLRHPAARGMGEVYRRDALALRAELAGGSPEIDPELAPNLYQRGDFAGAERVARRWTELAPHDPAAWNTLGAALLKLDRADEGIAALRTAVEKAPTESKYAYNLGLAQLRARRFEEAVATLEPLRKGDAVDKVVAPLAEALIGAGRGADARALLAPLLEKQPDHLGALLTLGELELAEGRRDAARALAIRALAKNPKSERAQNLRRAVGD